MQANQNLAYDLSRYEPKTIKSQPNLELLEQSPRRRAYTPFEVVQIVCVVGILVAALSLVIYNNVILTELTDEINSYKRQYEDYLTENVLLTNQIASKMSLRNVEDYATTQLGLSKMEAYQIEYVDRCEGDKIVLTAHSPVEAEAKFADGLSSVMEYLRIAFNKN